MSGFRWSEAPPKECEHLLLDVLKCLKSTPNSTWRACSGVYGALEDCAANPREQPTLLKRVTDGDSCERSDTMLKTVAKTVAPRVFDDDDDDDDDKDGGGGDGDDDDDSVIKSSLEKGAGRIFAENENKPSVLGRFAQRVMPTVFKDDDDDDE